MKIQVPLFRQPKAEFLAMSHGVLASQVSDLLVKAFIQSGNIAEKRIVNGSVCHGFFHELPKVAFILLKMHFQCLLESQDRLEKGDRTKRIFIPRMDKQRAGDDEKFAAITVKVSRLL